MATSVETVGGKTLVTVEGDLTIFQAADAKPDLLMCLRQSERHEVEVDLSRVTELDSAGVQLFLMLKAEAQRLGKTLAFTHHSHTVLAVIDLLNLGSTLGDPVLLTA